MGAMVMVDVEKLKLELGICGLDKGEVNLPNGTDMNGLESVIEGRVRFNTERRIGCTRN